MERHPAGSIRKTMIEAESKTAGTAGSSVHYVVRLFRNFKGVRFRGPIHESIDSRGLTFQFSNFRIYHYGYILDRRGRNKKIEREEDILLRLTRDDPGTLEWFMYLFRNHLNQSRYRDVVNVYESNRPHIDGRKDNLFFPVVQYLVTVCYFNLEEMGQVQERLSDLLAQYPDSLDFNFLAGLYCSRIGDLDRSRLGFETYLTLSDKIEADPALRFGQQLIFNEGNQRVAKNFLARIHTDKAEYTRALELLEELLEEDEKNISVLMNIIQVHRAMDDAEGVQRSCKRLLEIDPDNTTAKESLEASEQAACTAPQQLLESELVETISLITKAHLRDDDVDRRANVHLCFLGAMAEVSRGEVLQVFCRDANLALAHAARDVRFHGLLHPEADAEAIEERCSGHFVSNCLFSNDSIDVLAGMEGAFHTVLLLDEDLPEGRPDDQQLKLLARAVRPGGQVVIGLTQASLPDRTDHISDITNFFEDSGRFETRRRALWPTFRELLVLQKATSEEPGEPVDLRQVFSREPVLPTLDTSALVSVIIPTHNRADHLPRSLASVLGQTYKNIEVFVVDDGSEPRVDPMGGTWPERVKLLRQEHQGCAAAVNAGLRECHGDYICVLNDDDVMLPGRVELQLRFFQTEPGLAMTHTDGYFYTLDHDHLGLFWTAPHHLPNEIVRAQLRGNVFLSPTVMFRRSCMEAVGLWDTDLHRAQDLDYWFRIVERGRTGALNVPTVVVSSAAIPGGNTGLEPGADRVPDTYVDGEKAVFEALVIALRIPTSNHTCC